MADINEIRRELEQELLQKEAILNYFRKNEANKIEVEKTIKNEGINVKKDTTHSGNAMENVKILETNIEKVNKEISLYEKNNSNNKPKFR